MDKDQSKNNKQLLPEFNTLEVIELLRSYKKRIIRCTAVFFAFGIFIAILSPKEYTSSVIMVPQITSGKGLGKKFSNIASLVGLNIDQGSGGIIFPNLYPLIAGSTPFRERLVDAPLYIKSIDSTVTFEHYLAKLKKPNRLNTVKQYTIGLPSKLAKVIRGKKDEGIAINDTIAHVISKEEKRVQDFLLSNLNISFNESEGYIKIECTMDDPINAAQVVQLSQKYLQQIIIEHNIQKAKDELDYILERYAEAEADFFEKRAAVGNFRDSNQNLITSGSMWRLDQLKAEYDLALNVYTSLGNQLETTKLQVKKDTPVFTVLKPATVPMEPSSPGAVLIVIQTIIFGLFVYLFFIIAKFYFKKTKRSFLNSSPNAAA